MPSRTLFVIYAFVIAASTLTVWLLFAVLPISAVPWLLPLVIAIVLILRVVVARRAP